MARWLPAALWMVSCAWPAGTPPQGPPASPSLPDVFAEYLAGDVPAADGFDFPVGDPDAQGAYIDLRSGLPHSGWRVATQYGEHYALGIHTGDDWNGAGGGDTDFGQPVHAVARGRVVAAGMFEDPWGGMVLVDHLVYENHERRVVRSVYAHLSQVDVRAGERVSRRQRIGAIGKDPGGRYPAHLHLEIRKDLTLPATFWPSSSGETRKQMDLQYEDPSPFIRERRRLFVPPLEPRLVLVSTTQQRMLWVHGAPSPGSWRLLREGDPGDDGGDFTVAPGARPKPSSPGFRARSAIQTGRRTSAVDAPPAGPA